MLNTIMIRRYAEYKNPKCRYAKCRHAEWRGANRNYKEVGQSMIKQMGPRQ
jgi:hypothetical protein